MIQRVTHAFRLDSRDPRPIWRQIEEEVRRLVAAGALKPGAAAPSIRDLARDLQVNPATVAKAYQRLTDEGVLSVKRGEGTFVAASPPVLAPREKEKELASAALRYGAVAVTVGATREEALQFVRAALAHLKGGRS